MFRYLHYFYSERRTLMSQTKNIALIFAAPVSKVIKKVFTFSLIVRTKSLCRMEGSGRAHKNAIFKNIWVSIYVYGFYVYG